MFRNLAWGKWLYGLTSGFIGGGATAVTGGMTVSAIDQTKQFAFGGWQSVKLMFTLFIVSGLLNAFFYLKSHPLPDIVDDSPKEGR